MEVTAEHKLQRFLHYGQTDNWYNLVRDPDLKIEDTSVINEFVLAGQPLVPLQHVVRAHKTGSANRKALLFALNCCIKIDSKTAKTSAYEKLSSIVQDAEDLLELMHHHFQVNKKSGTGGKGMGKGMRKFICRWYTQQDPYDLVLETSRVQKRHQWSHKDLIRLAHVKSQNTAVAAVLMAIMQGLRKTQEHYNNKPEAQPVLDYLSCVQDIKHCQDPAAAVKLIEKHSFDIDIVPTHLLKHPQVWVAALGRLPVRRVLVHLKSMARRGMLDKDSSPVLAQVLIAIKDPLPLAASKLQPAEVLLCERNAASGWEHPLTPDKDERLLQRPHFRRTLLPSSKLLAGLNKMMVETFKNVSKLKKKVLVCVDTREAMTTSRCWMSWPVSAAQAAAVTILSLVAAKCDVSLTTVLANKQLGILPLTDHETMDSLGKKMRETNGGVPYQVTPIIYATQNQKKYELILHITDCHTPENSEAWERLATYREEVEATARYILLATSTKSMKTSNPSDPMMLDIAGWEPDVMRVIESFARQSF